MSSGDIGSYHILRKLGEGGMGTVYLGEHALLGRKAAIKVLHPHLSLQPEIVQRFFNEARAASAIADPGIVQIFDFGHAENGAAYLVMELFDGESLDKRLERLGRLPWPDALRICRQLATSLAAAHAHGIVHRDLKPDNVFLVRDAEVLGGERAKILDFGIAKLVDERAGGVKTRAGMVMGTPPYMSPEQCRGAGEVDHRSDIYSLGCVLFHLLTGRPPFDREGFGELYAAHLTEAPPRPSQLVPELPPEVDAVVLRCLAKAPDARFASMSELADALAWAGHGAVGAPALAGHASPQAPTQLAYATGSTPAPGYVTPAPLSSRPPGPTTLGASAGQAQTSPPTLPAVTPRRAWWIAALGLAAATVAAIAVLATRSGGEAPSTVPAGEAGRGAGPLVEPDAAPDAAPGPPAIDASVVPDAPIDAGPLDASLPDAAAPVASPPTTPVRPPRPPRPRPPACDRTVDLDCDGIPDVR